MAAEQNDSKSHAHSDTHPHRRPLRLEIPRAPRALPDDLDGRCRRAGVQALFLLGCPTATAPELIGPHSLACPCPDDYPSLPQRTGWFCRWALGKG